MDTAQAIVWEFWGTLSEMAPYLLLGFLVAGVLSAFVPPDLVERHLGGKGWRSVLKSSLFGVPLPLCSCGVVPVAASLRRHGATRGATTAFLLSTPQTGVDSVLVTLGLLGPAFAVFRPLAALLTGVVGGCVVDAVGDTGDPNDDAPPACTDECCSMPHGTGRLKKMLRYGFVVLPRDIGRAMAVGLAIAGVIAVAVPEDFFTGALGSGLVAMLLMMVVGIPIYVCATASVPIAAALIAKGVSPGVALVFLVAGPATNAATLTTVWKVLGHRTTLTYLATVAVAAVLSGLLLDYLFTVSGMSAVHVGHRMLPMPVKFASAVVLLAILAVGMWHPKKNGDGGGNECCGV